LNDFYLPMMCNSSFKKFKYYLYYIL
jgi:hypothetical protein